MKIMKFLSLLIFCVAPIVATARMVEIPIAQLPTGQIILEIEINGVSSAFVYDATGKNLMRSDKNKLLAKMGADTTSRNFGAKELNIGGLKYSNAVPFKIVRNLLKRADLMMPDNVLGTVGPSLFKSKVVQLNLQTKRMRIADSFEELKIPAAAFKVPFTKSFTNGISVINVETIQYGEQELYIDPSKPYAFGFAWRTVKSSVKDRNLDKMTGVKVTLNGSEYFALLQEKEMGVFIENKIQIEGFKPTFSDDLIPAIGSAFLKHYIFSIDYENSDLYLEAIDEKGKTGISYFKK